MRGVPFSPSDAEPEKVDWVNDATRPLILAIAPREAAKLALRLAEETDHRGLPVARSGRRHGEPQQPAQSAARRAPRRASR